MLKDKEDKDFYLKYKKMFEKELGNLDITQEEKDQEASRVRQIELNKQICKEAGRKIEILFSLKPGKCD